jgi:hypothetical protein
MASRSFGRNWVVVAWQPAARGKDWIITRTQSARHRVDHGTICGRSCANSGHYKPLCACVDRTFVNPNSSRQRPEKIRAGESKRQAGATDSSAFSSLSESLCDPGPGSVPPSPGLADAYTCLEPRAEPPRFESTVSGTMSARRVRTPFHHLSGDSHPTP